MSRVLLDMYTQVKLLPSRMASDTEAPVLQRQKEKSAEQGMIASLARLLGAWRTLGCTRPATVEKAKVRTGLRADRVRPVIFRMRMLTAELLGCSDQTQPSCCDACRARQGSNMKSRVGVPFRWI